MNPVAVNHFLVGCDTDFGIQVVRWDCLWVQDAGRQTGYFSIQGSDADLTVAEDKSSRIGLRYENFRFYTVDSDVMCGKDPRNRLLGGADKSELGDTFFRRCQNEDWLIRQWE